MLKNLNIWLHLLVNAYKGILNSLNTQVSIEGGNNILHFGIPKFFSF